MRKLIIKTTLITIASILAVAIMAWGIITLCFPKALVNVSYDMGLKGLSVWYSEKAHQKSGDAADLEDLLYRANENKDYARSVKYSPSFFNTEKYAEKSVGDKNYFAGKYTVALYNGGTESSVIFAFVDGYNGEGYSVLNPYEYLVYSFDRGESGYTTEFLSALKSNLESKRTVLFGDALTLLEEDISVLTKLING